MRLYYLPCLSMRNLRCLFTVRTITLADILSRHIHEGIKCDKFHITSFSRLYCLLYPDHIKTGLSWNCRHQMQFSNVKKGFIFTSEIYFIEVCTAREKEVKPQETRTKGDKITRLFIYFFFGQTSLLCPRELSDWISRLKY